ncbi:amidohydrolase [Geofilum sp. OHC36d9]|uniref:amidohydrolase n=1 Tax=Geofilum sp. OHC36d9 TaxID=3458413 RepID=UPI0040334744
MKNQLHSTSKKNQALNITLVQFDIIWESHKENFQAIEDLLQTSQGNTDLIILPEMFNTGFSMQPARIAVTMDSEGVEWMKRLSTQYNAVVAGSMAIAENDKYFNRLLVVYPKGEIHFYDKRHLFTIAGEQNVYSPGQSQLMIEVYGWKIAFFVCYDLRFPVWSRNTSGYDLAVYVANWPLSRIQTWDSLLMARAIENQCYVVGVNRVGVDPKGNSYPGHSMVIDYKGQMLYGPATSENQTIKISLNFNALNLFKQQFPFWQDSDQFKIALK